MKKIVLSLGIIVSAFNSKAQGYWETMQDPNGNLYTAQQQFYQYFSTNDSNDKGKGYKAFKRWEAFVEPRVYPTGNLSLLGLTAQNHQAFLNSYVAPNQGGGKVGQIGGQNLVAAATWSPVGPMGPMAGTGNGQFLKSGRINGIVTHPTNTNVLYACAPAGGFWRSYNAGTTWVTTTDNMPNTGCSDAAVDPSNTNIIYLATGDGDAGDNPSIGVYKSFDAGVTFTPTGLTYTFSAGARIRRILINPNTPSVVIAATSGGVRRNASGGAGAWTTPDGANCYDLEFQPGNPNIVYAAGTSFRRSTDGGLTFTQITNGIPTTGVSRMAIGVTPSNPQVVYVLASLSSNNGFQGLYRSTDGGITFTQMSNSPNLLGWSNVGGDTGGQGWYDLCIAASPTNSNEIVTGGVNVWRSLSGGAAGTWTIYGHWTGSGAPFTHADHHDLEYDFAGNLYNSNDGTVYRRNGGSWLEISGQMNLSQIYKLGTSSQTANMWLTGHQDNGTSIWTGATYSAQLGGDGMDCFIDRTNNANKFAEYYNGAFMRSIGGGGWTGCTTGMTGGAPWVTIWKQDPTNNTRLHAGRQEMFVSNDLAGTWTQNGTMPVAGSIREFAIAPSNNQVIYVLKSGAIIKTVDGGANWTNVTNGAPIGSAAPDFVVIHPTNPNIAWVVLSGYSAANKVIKTTNGGTSWTNITGNLPNIPANCAVYQSGSNDRVYVGMDIGVYYIDNSLANWVPYQYNLPNIPVSDLEISPADPSKLVASTYGRGTWKVDVIAAAPPVTALSYTGSLCTNAPKPFYDFSANAPTVWSWSVTPMVGVTISNSTVANPTITFANAGSYTVSLFTSNIYGPGTIASQVVSVTATPTVLISNASQTICSGSSANLSASGAATYSWSNGVNTQSITVTPSVNTIYNVVGSVNGCNGSANATVTVGGSSLTLSANNPSICVGSTAVITASGAISYTWSTGALTASTSVSPGVTTTYTVTGSNGACSGVYVSTVTVNSTPTVSANNATICSGSSTILTASGATSYTWSTGALTNTVNVSPTVTAQYTVTGSNGGCSSAITRTVTVNPSPTVTANNPIICSGNSTILTASGATSYTWSNGALTNTTSVNPGTTTQYTVTGSNGGACNGIYISTVTVNATPTVSANNASICVGGSTVLTANGAATYTWSTGALTNTINVSPIITTQYTVTGANGACTNAITRTVTVMGNPTVTANNPSICNGSSVILTANGASNYTWSTGALTNTISVSPTVTTQYTVTGNNGACNSVYISTVTVNASPTLSANNASICSGNAAVLSASGALTYTWSTGALTSTVSVSPIVTTQYTVSGSNGSCSSSITRTVNVTTTPTVSVSNAGICTGGSTVLTAGGATSYTWSTGALTNTVSVSPGITTVYTVTGSNGNGCNNIQTVTVTVNNTPTVVISNSSQTICSGATVSFTASGALSYLWNTGANTSSVSVSPSVTTVYSVTGLNGSCSGAATATVNVNSTPTLVANSATLCAGQSTTLTANGAPSYTWSTGSNNSSINVSPSVTTVYTVNGSNGICNGSTNATVTVNQLPNILISSNPTLVCLGNTLSLNASGGLTYTWQPGNLNGASQTYTPPATQTYTVFGTDANNCNNTSTISVVVTPCTGILKNAQGEMYYSVYPNPSTDKITVSYPSSMENEIIMQIFDASGKLIVKETHVFNKNNPNFDLNIMNVAKGMYFLKLNVKGGESTTLKLIKN